jgi:hypothetical protein
LSGRNVPAPRELKQEAGAEGITKEELIPTGFRFLTSRALVMVGDVEARAVITRVEGRIED